MSVTFFKIVWDYLGTYYCLLNLVSTLCKKYERAIISVKETSEAYLELSAALDSNLVQTWEREERIAQVDRGESLWIYDIQLAQGE